MTNGDTKNRAPASVGAAWRAPAGEGLAAMMRGETFRQFVRFVIAGGMVTAFATLIYLCLALMLRVDAYLANAIAWVLAVLLGFALHSRWTFGDSAKARDPAAVVKFFCVSFGTMLMNTMWVWLLVGGWHLAKWTPALPMMFVTPLVTFAANKLWIFD